MTSKEKAEQYVRKCLPELMELSFGCRFLDEEDGIEYTVVERNDICDKYGAGKNEVWSVPNFKKGYQADWRFDSPGCGLKIIGHPIHPHHYLVAMDLNSTDERTLIKVSANMMRVEVRGIVVMFSLTTGQPATEADYQAFCNIVGI